MYSRSPLVFWSLLMCLLSGAALAAPAPQEVARNVARPSRGKVIGYVLDAQTRHPLAGVRITVEEDGAFPAAAKPVVTNDKGRFDAQSSLGKVSSSIDFFRLLTTHWIGILL